MPVIINEFEVVPSPPSQATETSNTASASEAAPNTLPQDVDSVLRLQYQREARTRAE